MNEFNEIGEFASSLAIPFLFFVLRIVIVLIALKVALKINKNVFQKFSDKLREAGQIKNITYIVFLRHIVQAIIYFIAVITIGQEIPGFSSATSALLASTGVLTVVIGFASQEAMSSVVSGIMILTFKPFAIGDVIKYDGIQGVVEEISLRHTILRTTENKRLIVPNASMNSSVIENANFTESKVCAFLEMGISYESSIDLAREIILNQCVSHKDYFDNRSEEEIENNAPKVSIRVVELGDSSVNLRAWIWAKDNTTAFVMKCDLLESIKKEFDEKGIDIPYPHVTVKQK